MSILEDFGSQDSMEAPSMSSVKRKVTRPSSRMTASPSDSTHRIQLKEMAVEALQSIRATCAHSPQPKDKFGILCDYMAAEMRSMNPERTELVKSKISRAFLDIVDETKSVVSAL